MTEAQEVERANRRVQRQHRWILRIGLAALIGGLLLIQLLPYGRDHTNPPVLQELAWDSAETRALAVRACFDCHSNETLWPWYTHIAPISMLVYKDVVEGRAVLNFSEWNSSQWDEAQTDRLIQLVSQNQMPLPYYVILHPEAELSAAEKGQLINGFIATLHAPAP